MTDRQILKVIGANIRKARMAADITQECLAELVGVHWHSISYLELGKVPLALPKFVRISKVLRVSPDRLFEGLPEPDWKQIDKVKKVLARKKPGPKSTS